MGQFSWLDCVDGSQIVDNRKADVFLLIPKEFGGGHIHTEYYDGYGTFGRYDVYDLVVDWNREYLEEYRQDHSFKVDWLQKCASVAEAFEKMGKRDIGISIACYDEDNSRLRYPIKITHSATAVYEECDYSPSDPDQGWPPEEDEEELCETLEDDEL